MVSTSHRFWIKINQIPELPFSCLCILCSPSAKLSYRLNFHSLLQNEPFKIISYSFSFPPKNMETHVGGKGRGNSVSFVASHVVNFTDWVTALFSSWWCLQLCSQRQQMPYNTQTQGLGLYHLSPKYGTCVSLPESVPHWDSSSKANAWPSGAIFEKVRQLLHTFPLPMVPSICNIKQTPRGKATGNGRENTKWLNRGMAAWNHSWTAKIHGGCSILMVYTILVIPKVCS